MSSGYKAWPELINSFLKITKQQIWHEPKVCVFKYIFILEKLHVVVPNPLEEKTNTQTCKCKICM